MKNTQETQADDKLMAKMWLANDKQSEIGYWSTQESDEAIWKLLKEQGHDGTGEIVTCEVNWDSCMSDTVLNWDDDTKKGA